MLFSNSPRAFTPTDEESESGGSSSQLADRATGDWSWKPGRSTDATPTFQGNVQPSCERVMYGCEQAQGVPRSTTPHTADGRLRQYNIPPEKQSRPVKTGDCPGEMQSTMKPIWDLINDKGVNKGRSQRRGSKVVPDEVAA